MREVRILLFGAVLIGAIVPIFRFFGGNDRYGRHVPAKQNRLADGG